MSAYKPPQDYSLVGDENDSYESEPNGIQLKPVLLNPLLAASNLNHLSSSNNSVQSTQPPYPQHVSSQSSSTAQVVQPGFSRAPLAPIPYAGANTINNPKRPPPIGTGKWADDICDWPSNLYPSCFCVCCLCDGIYLIAQMSQKTGFATMQNILYCYAIAWIVALVIHVSIGPFFLMMPFLFALTVSIFLRLHIVRKYGITESPACGECCCGFCCFSCSVAQMSRHVYGYTKLFDGDGDWERKDNYGGPALTV